MDINDKINLFPEENINKFISYVRCKMEDRRFFRKYNLDYSKPDGEKIKEIIYGRITKTKEIKNYFFSHVDYFLSLNPDY